MHRLNLLKFKPVFKDKIWGGHKIKTVLGQDFSPLPNCGEMWALSGVEGNQTLVSEGFLEGNELNELIEVYMGDLVGEQIYQKYGNEFPILIKIIDASDWLSIQVHPDDNLALKRHGCLGKSEMWYILSADEGAQLISGFSKQIGKEEYEKHLHQMTLKSIMNYETVEAGDVFYMPAGRVHALGPGILLAEIQQTSDITYRIYDWDRIDASGMMRELHIEEALDAIDFKVHEKYKTAYNPKPNETTSLVKSSFFITNLICFDNPLHKDYSELDSFVIYLCVEGNIKLKTADTTEFLKPGELVLLPATTTAIDLYPTGNSRVLEVYMQL